MNYRQDISGCFGNAGADRQAFDTQLTHASSVLAGLRSDDRQAVQALLKLPQKRDDLAAVSDIADRFRSDFDAVLILGTGGSSLGGKTICALAGKTRPVMRFLDNIDPASFAELKQSLDPATTGLLVISKSGGTVETLTQFVTLVPWFDQTKLNDNLVVITEPADNPLRRLASHFGARIFDHDPDIGGRYSCLSLVGLLPAMIAGLDATCLRDGAAEVLTAVLQGSWDAPARGAALASALAQSAPIFVMMPYRDRLAAFAQWYRQLWAESLGKTGNATTPVTALGTVDQHSQLQLYLDGPADKYFTFIADDARGEGDPIADRLLEIAGDLDYLRGRQMGDVLAAEREATIDALVSTGRPVRTFRIDELTERSLGALMMHFILETIVAAELFGVDPFDQPAVEEGKVRARAYLGDFATLAVKMTGKMDTDT